MTSKLPLKEAMWAGVHPSRLVCRMSAPALTSSLTILASPSRQACVRRVCPSALKALTTDFKTEREEEARVCSRESSSDRSP